MNTVKDLQEKVDKVFVEHFGRTPLTQRLNDILGEAFELNRYTDLKNLREETGDLLASTIQLANECGWNIEDLLNENARKIEGRKLQYKSLGRKKAIAIIGGAFNPPTVGHIKLAQFVLDTSNTFDEAWLMPCYSHMNGKDMVSPDHRLRMCELATTVDRRIKVFDYEIVNKLAGESYNLAKLLLNEEVAKSQYDFSMVIGMDNANTFNKWVNYAELERLMRFVVVSRKGIERKEDWFLNKPHIFLETETDIPQISSTDIRNALAKKDFEFLNENVINKDVLDYILTHNLYQ